MSVITGQKPKAQVPFFLQVIAVIACSWLVASIMVYYVVVKDAAEIAAVSQGAAVSEGASPLLGSININEALDKEAIVDIPVEPEESSSAPLARIVDKPVQIERGSKPEDGQPEPLAPSNQSKNVFIPDPNEPSSLFGDLPEPLPVEEVIIPENFEHENICLVGDTRTTEEGTDEFCVDGLWSTLIDESPSSTGGSGGISGSGGGGGPVATVSEPAPEPVPEPVPVCNNGETGVDQYSEDAVCYGGQWVANLKVDVSTSTTSFSPSAGELITIESTTNTSALTGVTIFPVLPDSTNSTDIALVEYLAKSNPSEEETFAMAKALIDGQGSSPAFQHKHTHELIRGHVETDVWTGELPYGGGVVPGQYVIVLYAQNYNMTDQTLAIIKTITVSN
jgi:hypothetical protein